jgi:hypothetical protein
MVPDEDHQGQRCASDQEEGDDLLCPGTAVCLLRQGAPIAVPDLDPE